uniref:Conotoxin B2 superfamily protein n=2 Tax=Conus TaxID=6490 RepID=A0AA49X9X0_CONFG|nr:conotoxin precursor B2 superfamily protein [Conus frigidus]WLP00771.1 conotoxin precursor B2 superfamily protein [Conus ebraeus]
MLRLIIAAVLASACLAFPQRRDGAPANAAPNLQPFNGEMAMPNMQPMHALPMSMSGMSSPQLMPLNPNLGMGFKRENLEKRRQHSQFSDDNKSPFDSEDGLGNFMNFMKENGNNLPFANMDSAATDLGHFEPSAENEDGKFRFFDKEQ